MRVFLSGGLWAVALLAAAFGSVFSGEAVVSTMQNVPAHFDYKGYAIRPAGTAAAPGDQGPTQLFEIVRPSNGAFSIGRIHTSCTCIQVTADKKSFADGESAVLRVRNVLPTRGNTYPFYVQLTSPVQATIRYDTYVISDNYRGLSQGTVISEEKIAADGIEVIVPKHEPAAIEKASEEEGEKDATSDDASPEGTVAEAAAAETDGAVEDAVEDDPSVLE